MLALRLSQNGSKKSQVNILPCRIHRNGPAKVTKRFWSPATEEDGSKTAYFRGRKLRGRRINLPKSYHGLAVSQSDQAIPTHSQEPEVGNPRRSEEDEDISEDEAQAEPVKILKEEAEFDEITIWGHDRLPEADDSFVKGIEEWIAFAEAIHTTPADTSPSQSPMSD